MQGLIEIYFGNHVSEIGFFVMFSKTKDYKFLFFYMNMAVQSLENMESGNEFWARENLKMLEFCGRSLR